MPQRQERDSSPADVRGPDGKSDDRRRERSSEHPDEGRSERAGARRDDRRRGRWEDKEFVGSDEVETGATERLTFFSDAVAAIAMTLLAIELPVPEGDTAQEFWQYVRVHWTEYFAFVISFVVIAAHWSSHHRIFRFVSRADNRLRLTNMCWLFAIVSIPFATKVISESDGWDSGGATPVRFAVYSGTQLLANGAMVAMLFHVQQKRLLRDDTPRILVVMSYWHSVTMATGFLLSIPLFFVWHRAWIMWFATPIVLGSIGGRYFAKRAGSGRVNRGELDTEEL